jgi:hypothetical protein
VLSSVAPVLTSVVLDCPDPAALATFWSRLLEAGEPTGDDGWQDVALPDGHTVISFQRSRRYRGPNRWRPQQLHLDLEVDDLDSGHDRVLALGARPLRRAKTFRVYADPAGHPFCLVAKMEA